MFWAASALVSMHVVAVFLFRDLRDQVRLKTLPSLHPSITTQSTYEKIPGSFPVLSEKLVVGTSAAFNMLTNKFDIGVSFSSNT